MLDFFIEKIVVNFELFSICRCDENDILADDRWSHICNIRWTADGYSSHHCSTSALYKGSVICNNVKRGQTFKAEDEAEARMKMPWPVV